MSTNKEPTISTTEVLDQDRMNQEHTAHSMQLQSKIESLNEMISLQQYYIDEWRAKYEDVQQENDRLKQQVKRIRSMEQENIVLHRQLKHKEQIIEQQNQKIHHLLHPCKWQWCDFEGYIWRDFQLELSQQIDEKYLNQEREFRYEPNNSEQMYQFKFNHDQKCDGDDGNPGMHRMVQYSNMKTCTYFIQRVPVAQLQHRFMDPMSWTGPARKTFGDKCMTLYHVTDSFAADKIKQTRAMKPGTIGRFGGAIYFAEKVTTAQTRAHRKGYVITARVLVGNEYVVNEKDSSQIDGTLSFGKLHSKGFDSVYAVHWTERVVYNADQICIVDVKKVSAFQFIFK